MIRALAILLALGLPIMAAAQETSDATGGAFRVLDKVTGEVSDVELRTGQMVQVGNLRLTLNTCRYPARNPSGDAFASVTVNYRDLADPVFSGWLMASAPALHAMDHPRYDVWVLRCSTS